MTTTAMVTTHPNPTDDLDVDKLTEAIDAALAGAVAKLGGEPRRLSFSFPDGRCVWAFSGRLEDPVDDHRVRVRLPVRSNIVP